MMKRDGDQTHYVQSLLFSMVNQSQCSFHRIDICAIRYDSLRRNLSTFADASWNARPLSLRIEFSFLLRERTWNQRGILQSPKCALKDRSVLEWLTRNVSLDTKYIPLEAR